MEIVVFRQITFDTAHFPPGGSRSSTLFEAVPRAHDGSAYLTALDEKAIVRWLLLAPPARQVLLEELGLPIHSFCCPEVVEPFYSPGERDLDLLLCPPLSPHEDVAIECKRVKVESINAGEDRINKLHETLGGAGQANKLYTGSYAFHQTYFAIITEADATVGQEIINIPNRGVRSETKPRLGDTHRPTFRQIVEFPGTRRTQSERRDCLYRDRSAFQDFHRQTGNRPRLRLSPGRPQGATRKRHESDTSNSAVTMPGHDLGIYRLDDASTSRINQLFS